MKNLNERQKEWLKNWLKDNVMTFKIEPEWNDVEAVHSSDIEYIYQKLKELEQS